MSSLHTKGLGVLLYVAVTSAYSPTSPRKLAGSVTASCDSRFLLIRIPTVFNVLINPLYELFQ